MFHGNNVWIFKGGRRSLGWKINSFQNSPFSLVWLKSKCRGLLAVIVTPVVMHYEQKTNILYKCFVPCKHVGQKISCSG